MSEVECVGCGNACLSNHSINLSKGYLCVECFKALLNSCASEFGYFNQEEIGDYIEDTKLRVGFN